MRRNNDKDDDFQNHHHQDNPPPLRDEFDKEEEEEGLAVLEQTNDDGNHHHDSNNNNNNDQDHNKQTQHHHRPKPSSINDNDDSETIATTTRTSQESDYGRQEESTAEEAVPPQQQDNIATATSTPIIPQPQHVVDAWEWFRIKHHSPKYWVAPLVGLSDKAFRILCRKHGANMAHTEMSDPGGFARSKYYRTQMLGIQKLNDDDDDDIDRPLVLQLGSSDINKLLEAIKVGVSLTNVIDAIEINCGCPQRVAQKGCYGAFLLDPKNQSKLLNIISTIRNSNVMPKSMPLLVKMRVLQSIDDTVNLARAIVNAGAGILTVHGRTRYQGGGTKTVGHNKERLASWPHIRAVKRAVSCPVIANGNVPNKYAVEQILQETGCDGVMSGCGLLRDPTLFNNCNIANNTTTTTTIIKSVIPDQTIQDNGHHDDDDDDNNEHITVDDDYDDKHNNNNNKTWNDAVHISIEYIELAIKYHTYPKRISKHLLWILDDNGRFLLNSDDNEGRKKGSNFIFVNLKSFPSIRKQIMEIGFLKVSLNNSNETNENENDNNNGKAVGAEDKTVIDDSNDNNNNDGKGDDKYNSNNLKKNNRIAYFGDDDNCVEGILKKLCQHLLETTN